MKKEFSFLLFLGFILLFSGCVSKKKFTNLLSSKEAVDASLAQAHSKIKDLEKVQEDYREEINGQQQEIAETKRIIGAQSNQLARQEQEIRRQAVIIESGSNCTTYPSSQGFEYSGLSLPLPYTGKKLELTSLLNLQYLKTVGDFESLLFHKLCGQDLQRVGYYISESPIKGTILMLPLEEITKDGTHIRYIENSENISSNNFLAILSGSPFSPEKLIRSTVFIIVDKEISESELTHSKQYQDQYDQNGAIKYFQNSGTVFSSKASIASLANKKIYCIMYVHEFMQEEGAISPFDNFSMDQYLKQMGF